MSSHWQTMGFKVDSLESLGETMQQVLTYAQTNQISASKYNGHDFDYYRVPIGTDGLEVWLVNDKKDPAFVMAHPHFVGRSRLKVQLAEAIHVGGSGDVAYYAYANPTGKNKNLKRLHTTDNNNEIPEIPECSFQIMMAPPNGQHALTFLNRDDIITVQCTGFCEDIQVFQNEQAYIASQKPIDLGKRARSLMGGISAFKHKLNKPVYLGSQRFMSYALMNKDEDDGKPPKMEANIAGIVQACHKLINPLTGNAYYYALILSADDQPFDITIAPEDSDILQPGYVVDGTFWLSARFFSPQDCN